MKLAVIIPLLALSLAVAAADDDLNRPFGFCTVSSRTDSGCTYNMTGGGCYSFPVPKDFKGSVAVLTSDGEGSDMKAKIRNSIEQYDVIILDGSKGDFFLSDRLESSKAI